MTNVSAQRLESKRLSLQSWEQEDWVNFRPIAQDPRVMRFISGGVPWPDKRIEEFVARQRRYEQKLGFCLWKLLLKGDERIAGYCGLQPLDDLPGIEIGWWLRPEMWGMELATAAAPAVLAEAFGRLGLDRIVAIAVRENVASLRVMEKLGMNYQRDAAHHGIAVVLYAIEKQES